MNTTVIACLALLGAANLALTIILWRKTMTPAESALASIKLAKDTLDRVAATGDKMSKSVAAIQDAGAKIIAYLGTLSDVPQEVLAAAAELGARASETLADWEIIEAAPADLDAVTSALLAGAQPKNPVAPLGS